MRTSGANAWFCGVFALIAGGVVGCGPSPEAREAERVLVAIDRLRNAPSTENRTPLIDTLAAEKAEFAPAREARDACVKAYRALEEGAAAEARARAAFIAAAGQATPAVVSDLVTAEQKVNESKEAMPACEQAQAALHRASR